MTEIPAFDPAPATLDEVRDRGWLTSMLATRWPGATVTGVETVELLATMATKVRLRLHVAGRNDAPTEICIKGVLTDTGAPPSASIVETLFYRDAAAEAGVRVPGLVYAELAADGDRGVVVMRDEIAAGGRFCSALDPFTPDEARDGLDELARLHAAGSTGGMLAALPWVPSFLDRIAAQPIMPLETLQSLLDGPRGAGLPAAILDAGALQRGVETFAARVRSRPAWLVHGDAHAGNVFRDRNARLGVVDWQVLQRGDWAQDVAYHLGAVLTPEDRRAHERELLDHYRDRLHAHGGDAFDREEAWTRYRAASVYGFFMWAITRKVEPAIINEFTRRLGTAVADLDGFAAAAV